MPAMSPPQTWTRLQDHMGGTSQHQRRCQA